MSAIVKETMDIINLLPENDQMLLNEIAKKLLLAWDPDFTKLTPEERRKMDIAEKELENGEYYTHEQVLAMLDEQD